MCTFWYCMVIVGLVLYVLMSSVPGYIDQIKVYLPDKSIST